MGKRVYNKVSKYKPSLFQGRFAFSAPRELSLAREHPIERPFTQGLIACLVILASLYLYFITATVLNVIARKDALSKVVRIEGSIGALEQKHFALSQDIDPSDGLSLGLTSVGDTDYVYRPGNVGVSDTPRNGI